MPPESIWNEREYTSIHAVVLSAELENVLMIAGTLSPVEYDTLLDSFHGSVYTLIQQLEKEGVPVGEFQIQGGQASICFYDPEEVRRNYQLDGPEEISKEERTQLIERCREQNENLAISALKAAIRLKNHWLVQEANIKRVLSHMDPWEIGIGIHYGRVFLANRPGGKRHIEGLPVHLARGMQSLACTGKYSHVMVSQQVHDLILRMVIKHTQLRQRIFFHKHENTLGQSDGLPRSHDAFELKFYHRIGIHSDEQIVEQYRAIFNLNSNNIWAYYQIHDYYAHTVNDWNTAYQYSKAANLAHPDDEKVLLDLAQYYLEQNKFAQSRHCAELALKKNDTFDLAHEHMALIATKTDDFETQIYHWRCAVNLSPNSAVNNFNLGLVLICAKQPDEGFFYVQQALRIFPEYRDMQSFKGTLTMLKNKGLLPELLEAYLEYSEESD